MASHHPAGPSLLGCQALLPSGPLSPWPPECGPSPYSLGSLPYSASPRGQGKQAGLALMPLVGRFLDGQPLLKTVCAAGTTRSSQADMF